MLEAKTNYYRGNWHCFSVSIQFITSWHKSLSSRSFSQFNLHFQRYSSTGGDLTAYREKNYARDPSHLILVSIMNVDSCAFYFAKNVLQRDIPKNTRVLCKQDHCTADLLFYWFWINQTCKSVDNFNVRMPNPTSKQEVTDIVILPPTK